VSTTLLPSAAPAAPAVPPSAPAAPAALPALHAPTPAGLGRVAAELLARPLLWRHLVRFDEGERHYVRLGAGPGYEAWLLTWLPGQSTGLHDHGGSAGAFVVAGGTLRETVPAVRDGATTLRVQTLTTGRVRAFGSRHVHDVEAASAAAVSLHVYAPALATMTRYRLDDGRLVVTAREGAGADW